MEQQPKPPSPELIFVLAALVACVGAFCGFTLAGFIGIAAGMTTEFLGLTGRTSLYLFPAIGGALGFLVTLLAFALPTRK